jgi:hypothetical protein
MVTAAFISRLSHAVDLIEKRMQQNRPFKVVQVRYGVGEDREPRKIATSRPIPRIETRMS